MTLHEDPLPRVPWWIKAIVVAALSVLGTLYTNARNNAHVDQSSIVQRVSNLEAGQQKLEAHVQDDREDIQYIKTQLDKLTEWALGHK